MDFKSFFRRFSDSDDRPLWATVVVRSVVIGFMFVVFAGAYYFLILRDDRQGSSDHSDDPGAPTTTVHPREVPPQMPQVAKRDDLLGVQKFIYYYFEVSNYVQRTGDVEKLAVLYDLPKCSGCQKIVDKLTENTTEGRYIRGGEYVLTNVAADQLGDYYFAVVTYNRSESQVLTKKDNKPVGSVSEEMHEAQGIVDVIRNGDHWLVSGLRAME